MADVKYLTRQAIRQMVLARMGWTTDDANLAAQVVNQVNEFIRQANTVVIDLCQWQTDLYECTFQTGIAQSLYNYPSQDVKGTPVTTGPQGVIEIARFDTDGNLYRELTRQRIRLWATIDESLSGSDVTNQLDKPLIYELRQQIKLWPVPDQVYTMRVLCTQDPDISAGTNPDGNVSVVDAEAIAIYATALCKREDGDSQAADQLALGPQLERTEFGRHIASIRRSLSSLQPVRLGRNDWIRRRYRQRLTYTERYGRDRWLPYG